MTARVDRTCRDEGGSNPADAICSAWPHPSTKSLYADNLMLCTNFSMVCNGTDALVCSVVFV